MGVRNLQVTLSEGRKARASHTPSTYSVLALFCLMHFTLNHSLHDKLKVPPFQLKVSDLKVVTKLRSGFAQRWRVKMATWPAMVRLGA